MNALRELPDVRGVRAGYVTPVEIVAGASESGVQPQWTFDEIAGRLVELLTPGAASAMSYAALLVRDAQVRGEPVAWVMGEDRAFFPPDLVAAGVDLQALVVVRVPGPMAVCRAADRLARSGAFGLLVLDLLDAMRVPLAIPSRLAGLARRHEMGVLCLMEKRTGSSGLGAMVSLRCEAHRGALGVDGEVACHLAATKDRRRGGRWTCEEVFRAPDGLC